MESRPYAEALGVARGRSVKGSESKAMEINVLHTPSGSSVQVSGDVDKSSSPRLREAILELLTERSESRVVVNLERVTYIDSSGIASLVEGLQSARKRKAQFGLACLKEGPRHALELTRLLDVFEVYATEADALEG